MAARYDEGIVRRSHDGTRTIEVKQTVESLEELQALIEYLANAAVLAWGVEITLSHGSK